MVAALLWAENLRTTMMTTTTSIVLGSTSLHRVIFDLTVGIWVGLDVQQSLVLTTQPDEKTTSTVTDLSTGTGMTEATIVTIATTIADAPDHRI